MGSEGNSWSGSPSLKRLELTPCGSRDETEIANLYAENAALQSQLSEMAAREVVLTGAMTFERGDHCECLVCGNLWPSAEPADHHKGCAAAIPSPQAARLVADAERYRKLRNQDIEAGFPRHGVFIGRIPENLVITGEEADSAIDALTGNTKDAGGGNG